MVTQPTVRFEWLELAPAVLIFVGDSCVAPIALPAIGVNWTGTPPRRIHCAKM